MAYQGTVSWGTGTREGPEALLHASAQVETWDERLGFEPCRVGITTRPIQQLPPEPAEAVERVREEAMAVLREGRYPVMIGGEHSLSYGLYRALAQQEPELGVIQLDAHADLREEYGGTPHSHACVLARIREDTDAVLQLGIRSLSPEEAERIDREGLAVGYMHQLRSGRFDWEAALERLPERIFLTLDLDALDLSLIRSTGTPEPGGFGWEEIHHLLEAIFQRKTVVGFDLMELCSGDPVSAFVAARLLYRMIGWRFPDPIG